MQFETGGGIRNAYISADIGEFRLEANKANPPNAHQITLDDTDWGSQVDNTTLGDWLPDNWLQLYAPTETQIKPAFPALLVDLLGRGQGIRADCCARSVV